MADQVRHDQTRRAGTDPRFEEIQDEIDEIRARIPKNPGLGVPDPDVRPVMPPEERDEPGPPL